ncbi:MAG: MATE family efflux transporter [Clostridiales bacterium]|nr:MATE family efflux transporter [Clostridiales bacterium]
MTAFVKKLFEPDKLIKASDWVGEKPGTREVYSTLWRVAWPSALESVLVGLIAFFDTVMVGTVGSSAIAAVGLTNQPRLVFFAVFFALNVGVTAVVSRRRGQEDSRSANRCLGQAVMLVIIISVILCAVAVVFSRPFLYFAGANEDTIEDSVSYFRITMVGMSFTALGMVINAAQRGSGNTRISMTTNLTANIINIVLNYLLIGGNFGFPRLEVRGAAIATLMGNIVACVMSIISVSRQGRFLKLRLKYCFTFDRENLALITKIASSAAVEQVFMRIGFFLYAKIVASLGTQAFATHQICMSIINLSFTFGDGLGIAASSLVGQNLGRKRPDLSSVYGKAGQRVGFVISMMLFVLFSCFGRQLMGLFTDEQPIISTGVKILYIVAFSSIAQVSQVIFSGCLRGAGDTKYVAVTSLVCIALVRPVVTYLFCYTASWGVIGAWASLIIDQYMRLAFSFSRFEKGKWKKIKI